MCYVWALMHGPTFGWVRQMVRQRRRVFDTWCSSFLLDRAPVTAKQLQLIRLIIRSRLVYTTSSQANNVRVDFDGSDFKKHLP
jgi:hypothetical protein